MSDGDIESTVDKPMSQLILLLLLFTPTISVTNDYEAPPELANEMEVETRNHRAEMWGFN